MGIREDKDRLISDRIAGIISYHNARIFTLENGSRSYEDSHII